MMTEDHHVLAVDIGGTKLETAVVSSDGQIVPGSRQRRPTGADRAREDIARDLQEAARLSVGTIGGRVRAAGIGSAGPIDIIAGTTSPHNLPSLRDLPVRDLIEAAVEAPTTLRLDGTCIALAEHWLGATQGARTSMSLVVSTGVGGGIIIDGKAVAGGTGNAGHIGQLHLNVGAPTATPEDSTVEALSSGPSAVRWANTNGWKGHTGEDLAAAVTAGDPVAVEATRRSADHIGQAIASVATLLDLDAVAVGGGFANVRADYLDIVRESARRYAIFPYARRVRIAASGLAGTGPLLGAAALCFSPDAIAYTAAPQLA
jgi:glucokinase